MSDQFERNLDSLNIQFRVKKGEKREIYNYALSHGFNNISAFIKNLIWGEIRGIKNESQKDLINEILEKITDQDQRYEQLMSLILETKGLNELIGDDNEDDK